MVMSQFRRIRELVAKTFMSGALDHDTASKIAVKKRCLQCRTVHYHHNDFCSRDCCLQYKVAHRGK